MPRPAVTKRDGMVFVWPRRGWGGSPPALPHRFSEEQQRIARSYWGGVFPRQSWLRGQFQQEFESGGERGFVPAGEEDGEADPSLRFARHDHDRVAQGFRMFAQLQKVSQSELEAVSDRDNSAELSSIEVESRIVEHAHMYYPTVPPPGAQEFNDWLYGTLMRRGHGDAYGYDLLSAKNDILVHHLVSQRASAQRRERLLATTTPSEDAMDMAVSMGWRTVVAHQIGLGVDKEAAIVLPKEKPEGCGDHNLTTPLLAAVMKSDIAMVDTLLELGADANARRPSTQTDDPRILETLPLDACLGIIDKDTRTVRLHDGTKKKKIPTAAYRIATKLLRHGALHTPGRLEAAASFVVRRYRWNRLRLHARCIEIAYYWKLQAAKVAYIPGRGGFVAARESFEVARA